MNKPKAKWDSKSHEVRTWRAWYRYVTLALLAYAALVVMRGQARTQEKKVEQPLSGST